MGKQWALWTEFARENEIGQAAMVQNSLILRLFPMSLKVSKQASEPRNECSEGRERCEQPGASEWLSEASKGANRRARGPVLMFRFMAVLNHSADLSQTEKIWKKDKSETSLKWHKFMFPTDRWTDGLTNRQTQHPLIEMRDVKTSVQKLLWTMIKMFQEEKFKILHHYYYS